MSTLTYEFSTKILHSDTLAMHAVYFALLFYQFESFASLNYSTSSPVLVYIPKKKVPVHIFADGTLNQV